MGRGIAQEAKGRERVERWRKGTGKENGRVAEAAEVTFFTRYPRAGS